MQVNIWNREGELPLHSAARTGLRDMVETLVDNGAQIGIYVKQLDNMHRVVCPILGQVDILICVRTFFKFISSMPTHHLQTLS